VTRPLTPQEEAERRRWLATEQALVRLRQDLALRGVGFSWERVQTLDGERLIGKLKGRDPASTKGVQESAFAMTILQPFFPSAVIEGGGVRRNGQDWIAILWLDAPEGEAARREDLHPELEPEASPEPHQRCPHDGATCKGRPSLLLGAPPILCERTCARERAGRNLPKPRPGFPKSGHEFPAVPK
jgi:hypothetical protein